MYFVYILVCRDNKLYTGCTSDLKARLERHNKMEVASTASRLPVVLASYISFKDKYKAYRFERYLKSGSGRAFLKKHLL